MCGQRSKPLRLDLVQEWNLIMPDLRNGVRAALMMSAVVAGSANAEYPERPVRLIIPGAAGGSADICTRILAIELVKQMGQQIVIDNRPGGAQNIRTEMVVRANPDGYTIGYSNGATL